MSRDYLVIYEREGDAYAAYVPDLPRCVAVGKSLPRVKQLIRGPITLHIDSLAGQGLKPPRPTTRAEIVPSKVA